jgi:hypothetical protein
MKPLIASVVSLLLGAGIGCFVGYRYYEWNITNEAVQQMLQEMDSHNQLDAARAIRAIEIIESGRNQSAVQFLCRPIADYYYMYSIYAGTNDEHAAKLRARIENLIRTNQIVANEMTNEMTFYQMPGKIH